MKQKTSKKNKIYTYIALIFVIIIFVYAIFLTLELSIKTRNIFANVEQTEASLTEYIVYGPHLRVKGNLLVDNENRQWNRILYFRTNK